MKRISFIIFTMVFSVLLFLVFSEIMIRLLGYKPVLIHDKPFTSTWALEDDELGWINRTGTFDPEQPGNRLMTLNHQSYRQDPYLNSKLSSGLVWIVGGSFTQGYGVDNNETYPSLLNRMNKDYRFENYGVGGYGVYQSWLTLDRMLKKHEQKPDVVIFGFIEDHLRRDVASLDWQQLLILSSHEQMVPPHVRLGNDKELVFHVPGKKKLWMFEDKLAIVHSLHFIFDRLSVRPSDHEERLEVMKQLILRMKTTAEAAGAKFIVVALDYADLKLLGRLKTFDENFIDCRPQTGLISKYRLGGYRHPNEKANLHWAECISPVIENLEAGIH